MNWPGTKALSGTSMIKCEEVLRMLYDYMDNQLDNISAAQVEEHLKLCQYCRRHQEFEVALQKLVTQSCFKKKAPEVLRYRIIDLLDKER